MSGQHPECQEREANDLAEACREIASLKARLKQWQHVGSVARNEVAGLKHLHGEAERECEVLRARVAELEGERDDLVLAIEASEKPHSRCGQCGHIEIDPPDAAGLMFECPKCIVAELQAQLERANIRLSEYECPDHPDPKFGECDECDRHNPEPKEVM